MSSVNIRQIDEGRASGAVGVEIRRAREACGMTLVLTAERVGCAKSYLSAVENGHKGPPSVPLLRRLEEVLGLPADSLVRLARWSRTPEPVRREMLELSTRKQTARRLAALLRSNGGQDGESDTPLDRAYQSGELQELIERLGSSEGALHVEAALPTEVPLINCVTAGYPTDFTDLGYPARVADEYVRCPGLNDPDAFAARVVGDSMSPEYLEGDIVVFSPLCDVNNGSDCFVRLAPDSESTFKRIYFERSEDDREMIRLQPINNRYPPRTYERERVEGLYKAVSVTRKIG